MTVKRFFSFLCLLSLLMLTIVTPAAAHRSIEANTPGDIPWTTGIIDTAAGVFTGKQVSLAYTPDNQIPYISYYDATNKDLRMASYVSPGASNANCGPNNDWYCQTVDSNGDVGQYSSIAVTDEPLFRKIGIAYRDDSSNALKYASFSCGHGCSWSIQTIQASSNQLISYGLETSLRYDSTGSPHIAYYSSSILAGKLIYVHKVSSGGNCGVGDAAGTWQCDQIDSGTGVGHSPSLSFYDNDTVVIAYLDTQNG